MANQLGNSGVLKLSTTTVAEFRSYTLQTTTNTVEDTVIGDAWKTHRAIQKEWSVNGDLYWDLADAGQIAMGLGSTVTVNLYPLGIAASSTYYQGSGIVTSLQPTARHDSMVEYSFTIQGTGTLSTLTV